MKPSSPISLGVAFAGVMAAAAALSLTAFRAQCDAFAFRGHDFAFFAAQYQRLLDSPPWTGLPLHPSGRNVFGFSGADGYPTLHHDIHLTPIKYALAGVFELTGSLLAVQAVLVLTYLLALGYVLRRLAWRTHGLLVLGVIAIIALSPWFVRATCFDMRTYVALSPFVVALATALLSRAPSAHVFAIALFGLCVREEAALLLALGAIYLELDGRRLEARGLYALALAYVLAFHALYAGPLGFTYDPRASALAACSVLLALPALALAPSRARAWAIARFEAHRPWAIVILGLPFAAIALASALTGLFDNHAVERLFPAVVIALLATTHWLTSRTSGEAHWRATLAALGIAALLCGSSAASIVAMRANVPHHARFWDAYASLPTDASIVTDYDHYDAFAARERVLVWERAPVLPAPGALRVETAARDRLLTRLRSTDVLVLVSPVSYRAIGDAMAAAGDVDGISVCVSDPTLVIARTGDAVCPIAPARRDARSITR